MTSLREIYYRYLESPGTKAYSVLEARNLFNKFRHVNIKIVLSHGDLLMSQVGQRHRGVLLQTAKAIWPRKIIRTFFPNLGLGMLIHAVK